MLVGALKFKDKSPVRVYTFYSSNGSVVTDTEGYVLEDKSNLDDYLVDIARMNIPEFRKFLKETGCKDWESIYNFDILGVGYWNKDGSYEPAEESWREDLKKYV